MGKKQCDFKNCTTTVNCEIIEDFKTFSCKCLIVSAIIHVATQWHVFLAKRKVF